MKEVNLQPARSLLEGFSVEDLRRLARRAGVSAPQTRSKGGFTTAIVLGLDLDEIVTALRDLFPDSVAAEPRLDTTERMSGAVTVQTASRADAALGELFLERSGTCLALQLPETQLFLENRWPVLLREVGPVPHERLYAGFVRPGQVHPDARMAPPRRRPFIVDEGEYGLRQGRLRMELRRAGLLAFAVSFLRRNPATRTNDYLLVPIA